MIRKSTITDIPRMLEVMDGLQVFADGNPEILHALSVGMQGANKTEIIAGFLHDVVEDTDMTLEDLASAGFSQEVITRAALQSTAGR